MRITPCVDLTNIFFELVPCKVSIPDEDYPLCRRSGEVLSEEAEEVLFPSPMRIIPCVDGAQTRSWI